MHLKFSDGAVKHLSGHKEIKYAGTFHLQIRFGSEKLLTAVATQGRVDPKNSKGCWTKEYFLEYRNNGTGWAIHKEDDKRRVSKYYSIFLPQLF